MPKVVEFIRQHAADSRVIIGTYDPDCDPEVVQMLQQEGATVLVLPQADHSLDIEGDTLASLENPKSLLEAMKRFWVRATHRSLL